MATQTAWYRATPGGTYFAYPLSQDLADWATYVVAFTEKSEGGGWYSASLDDTYEDWAIFSSAPGTDWDDSEYSIVSLSSFENAPPYYPTVRRNATDQTPLKFSWGSDTTLTAQVSVNGAAFTAVSGTISSGSARGGYWLYELSYHADDRPEDGIAEFAITDGTSTMYLPLTVDTGGEGGSGGSGDGSLDVVCTVQNDSLTPLSNLRVFVQNSAGVDLDISTTTSSLGEATFRLDPGTYKFGVPNTTGYESYTPVDYIVSASTLTPSITLTASVGSYRTTAELVGSLLAVTASMDLEPFIATAHNLVDQVEECDSSLSATTLELIERWLAAHFYAVANPQHVNSKSIGGASKSFALGQLGERVHSTYYGQQAILLDTSGCLEKITSERATVTWMGDESSLSDYDVDWN